MKRWNSTPDVALDIKLDIPLFDIHMSSFINNMIYITCRNIKTSNYTFFINNQIRMYLFISGTNYLVYFLLAFFKQSTF